MKIKVIWDIVIFLLVMLILYFSFNLAYKYYYTNGYPIPMEYSNMIKENSMKYNIPPEIILSVMRTESGFNPKAISSVGARGLMQITKDTFEWAKYKKSDKEDLSFDQLFDANININYGTYILSLLIAEFDGVREGLAAYHAGWGNVKKWLEDKNYSANGKTLDKIPFGDTSWYVDRIEETAGIYKRLYNLNN